MFQIIKRYIRYFKCPKCKKLTERKHAVEQALPFYRAKKVCPECSLKGTERLVKIIRSNRDIDLEEEGI